MVLKVVLAEDNTLLREGMVRLFDADPDIDVVAAFGDPPAVLH